MALVALVDSEAECQANNNLQPKRSKSIQLNIINYLELIKKLQQNKLEKLSEKKHSNNIPTKEAILINSKKLQMLIKLLQILKKDNCMINMESKVFKMEALLVELVVSVIFSAFSEGVVKDKKVQEKQSQSSFKLK